MVMVKRVKCIPKKTAPKGTAQYLCFNSYALPWASFKFIKISPWLKPRLREIKQKK